MLTRPMDRMMGPDGPRHHHRWMERGEGGPEDGPRFGEHRFGPGSMGRMGWSEEERDSGRL